MFNICYFALLLIINLTGTTAEVTILQGEVQTIYDRSPKLRIKGAGFDAKMDDITLELSATGQPSLVINNDFTVANDEQGEGVVLKLLPNRR